MCPVDIEANYRRIRESLPPEVDIVVAAKGRTPVEIRHVLAAGALIIGENYVQEAELHRSALGEAGHNAGWHMIGHLQRNKVNKALPLFSAYQSVDSPRLARALNKRLEQPTPVLVEVNIGGEQSKHGVPVDRAEDLVEKVAGMENLRLQGLMTMEPYCPDPGDARPYFRRMRELYDRLRDRDLPGAALETLSMGMSHSYEVAVEEGANMVRIGTAVFGPREG
jgi:hypothetical protein